MHHQRQHSEPVSPSQEEQDSSESSSAETTAIFVQPPYDRKVGFATDVVDTVSSEDQKLHRRDTPHHLKNKRLNAGKAEEEQQRVAAILSKSELPAITNLSSPDSPSHRSTNVKPLDSVSNASFGFLSGPVEIKTMKVEVIKTGAGLGLSIAGGKGSTPFKGDDEGIFVSRITDGGAAQIAGLQVGDKLLYVNEHCLKEVDHYKAVHILKSCGARFVAQIEREVPVRTAATANDMAIQASAPSSPVTNRSVVPSESRMTAAKSVDALSATSITQNQPHIFHTTLIRDHNGLGFSCRKGKPDEHNIYISRILPGGAAERDGKIKVGDRILKIGYNDVAGVNYSEAIAWLCQSSDGSDRFVRLVLERMPEQAEAPTSSSSILDSSSYMANRPSYTGSYRRPALGSLSSLHSASESTTTTTSRPPKPAARTFNGNSPS